MSNTILKESCEECGSFLIEDHRTGKVFCSACGLEQDYLEYDRSPRRAFTWEEKERKRFHGPPLEGILSLDTTISKSDIAKMRGEDRRWTFYRIRKRQGKIAVEGTVTLRKAYSIIDRILEGCGVKSWEMKKQARDYFRRCHSKGLCKGKHSSILAAATSYLGLRYGGVSTSLDEIAESLLPLIYLSHWEFYDEELKRRIEKLSSLPEKKRKKKEEKEKERFRRRKIRDLRKQISSFYRYILREMGWSPPLQNPIEYIPKIASLIEDPMKRSKLEKIAIEIAKQARERKLVGGKSPISIAAASIYMASQVLRVNLTQENIAREAGVTEVTVRKYYRLLANSLYDLFPISRRKNRPFLESRRKKRRFWAWLS